MITFLYVDTIIEIQQETIDTFGGSPGVRDMALVESAVFRVQTGYYDSMTQCAAALMESLLINHAFVDGNKRVAFFATDAFLGLNGFYLNVSPAAAEALIVKAIVSKDRFEILEKWIDGSIRPL